MGLQEIRTEETISKILKNLGFSWSGHSDVSDRQSTWYPDTAVLYKNYSESEKIFVDGNPYLTGARIQLATKNDQAQTLKIFSMHTTGYNCGLHTAVHSGMCVDQMKDGEELLGPRGENLKHNRS